MDKASTSKKIPSNDPQQRLRTLLDTSHEAAIGIDAAGHISEWNRQAESLFGWSREEAEGRSLAEMIIPARFHAAHHAGMAHFHATGEGPYLDRQMTVQALHRDGHELTLQMTISVLDVGDACAFIAFLHDASAQVEFERKLVAEALRDPLTGLANRRAFMLRLEEAMRRAQRSSRPMALLYMDIDYFKSINDSLGHGTGDDLLRAFANRLQAQVREVDLVARLGGDEFTVILEALNSRADAEAIAAKLVPALGAEYDLPERRVKVSSSIGLEIFEGGALTADGMINHADQAMYRAKRAGRGTWRAYQDAPIEPKPRRAHERLADFIAHNPRVEQRNDFLKDVLSAIREHLGMQIAFIAEFTEGRRVFRHIDAEEPEPPIRVDDSDPLEDSYCQRVVDGRLPELIPDAFEIPEAMRMEVTTAVPVRGHVSVPIRLSDGRVYGTFCCFSRQPDPSLNERDLAMMRIFSNLVVRHLERSA